VVFYSLLALSYLKPPSLSPLSLRLLLCKECSKGGRTGKDTSFGIAKVLINKKEIISDLPSLYIEIIAKLGAVEIALCIRIIALAHIN
jgi:hypothetical protein